jgi:hypothetical protein
LKVLTATNVEQLDKAIADDFELVDNPVHYREAVVQIAQKEKPDVVVITAWLEGTANIVDIVYELRSLDIRVVFLAGTLNPSDPTVQEVAKLSVYDILFGEISIGQVIDKIQNPTPASQGMTLINGSGYVQEKGSGQKVTGKVKLDYKEDTEDDTCKESRLQKFLNIRNQLPKGISLPKLPSFKRKDSPKENGVRYIPHHIITVWNPIGGPLKSLTALNLAATATEQEFDAALINFNLTSPLLDKWFKIPNTSMSSEQVKDTRGAGVMTFGAELKPDLVANMLNEYGWGIRYLPAGNKLGNIGTPDIPLQTLDQIIQIIFRRETRGKPAITIIDTDTSFELPTTYTVLKNASILLVPTQTKQEDELINDQLAELDRLKIKPKIFKIAWGEDVPHNSDLINTSSKQRKPYCFFFEENPFVPILDQILT